jgi:hypothetical protein
MERRGEAEENGREEEAMKECHFEDVENVGQVSEYQTNVFRGETSRQMDSRRASWMQCQARAGIYLSGQGP